MKLMNYTNIFSIFCITACALVSASPLVDLTARDVFDPHIIRPNEKTVWIVGTKRKVVWDTSNRPVNITNPIGMITLNKGGETTPVILGNNFSILDANHTITVPWVIDGDDYSIILFGDSGNQSEEFSIKSA